jgi:predicted transcriptional regulator
VPRRLLLWGFRPPDDGLHGLGSLEVRAVRAVWRLGRARVREVREALERGVAYTTVMTVLDRLYKKGMLERHRAGRAYVYSAAASPEEIQSRVAMGLLQSALGGGPEAAAPVLSSLVDAVGERDRQLLDELDRLVREKRREIKRREGR